MNPESETVATMPPDWLHIESMDLDAQGIARAAQAMSAGAPIRHLRALG